MVLNLIKTPHLFFNSNSLDFELESQQLTQKNSSNISSPLINLQNELAMITSSSLSETIEGLSLGYRKGSARKEEEARQSRSCSMICKSCLLLPIVIK